MAEEKYENIFADGLSFKKPRENAPDFIKGCLSVKVDQFTAFINKYQKNGWVNIDLKKSKKGTLYLALNTYEKKEVPTINQDEPPMEDEMQF